MNFDRAAMLLRVAEKAQQWPVLHPLRDAALKELQEIQKEKKPGARAVPSTERKV